MVPTYQTMWHLIQEDSHMHESITSKCKENKESESTVNGDVRQINTTASN